MSREQILSNIRRGLGTQSQNEQRKQTVNNRISAHAANLIPSRAQLPFEEQVALFKSMAHEAAAEIIELDSVTQVPDVLAGWLNSRGINEVVCASEDQLNELDWSAFEEHNIRRSQRPALAGDRASLTTSFAGIAETGTVMMHSGPQSPTTLNFLPDTHLVILFRSTIVGVYEEAWSRIREKFGSNMPRTVNMITGPSRSADIEQKLQMGAHGPKDLVILFINN